MVGQGENAIRPCAWVTLTCATGFEGWNVTRGTGLMDHVEGVYYLAALCVKRDADSEKREERKIFVEGDRYWVPHPALEY